MTARCALTELFVSDCAHCRRIPDPLNEFRQYGTPFRAEYAGKCAGCGDDFHDGDTIRADGAGGYLASCCDPDRSYTDA